MWGYEYTTTAGEIVYVYYTGEDTDDVYTYTLDKCKEYDCLTITDDEKN